MFSLLTDLSNFTIGAVSGTADRAGKWGSWGLGYRGESVNKEGQFRRVNVGGLIFPSIAVGLIAAASGAALMAPVIGFATWIGGSVALAALGGITGFVSGGFHELAEGRAARREWNASFDQERDQARLSGLREQMGKLQGQAQGKVERLQKKAEKVQTRMQKRAESHSFAAAEDTRRAAKSGKRER